MSVIRKVYFLLTFLWGCCLGFQTHSKNNSSYPIAKIGNKVIYYSEFIQRAEFTPRPPYCRNNTYFEKKIILNSLIAEKYLALEAGEENELTRNKDFNLYITGRKEQFMRQLFFHNEVYEKVKLDSSEIEKVYNVAGRKYKVNYLYVNPEKVNKISEQLKKGIHFEEICKEITGTDSLPQKEISFNDNEHNAVHNALFTDTLSNGQILNPVRIDKNTSVIIRIDGWVNRLAISDKDIKQRYTDVVDRMTEKKAWADYDKIVAGIMKGKQIEFDPFTFDKLRKIAEKIYCKSVEESKKEFEKNLWNQAGAPEVGLSLLEDSKSIGKLKLFSIDGESWTVNDFREEFKKHPLVFRKQKLDNQNFPEQFKLAIVDMIRDKYITDAAYKKNYDKDASVIHSTEMWKDYMISVYQKNKYLDSINCTATDELKIVKEYLTPYVKNLKKKYGSITHINLDDLEKIELLRTDMVALQPDNPFALVTPMFPMLIDDHKIDYGSLIKSEK